MTKAEDKWQQFIAQCSHP